MAQYGRPAGTSNNSFGWCHPHGAATIQDCMNEVVPNDTTYMETGGTGSAIKIQLTTLEDPGFHANHIIRGRMWAPNNTMMITVSLRKGDGSGDQIGALIEWSYPVNGWHTYEATITEEEAATITNYNELFFYVQIHSGDPVQISWLELQIGLPAGNVYTHAVAMPDYAGIDRGIPMQGERSAWDTENYPERHADIIDDPNGIHWTEDGIVELVGGTIADHDHSGDAGDGGHVEAENLLSTGASSGDLLTADGVGGAAWGPLIIVESPIEDHDHSAGLVGTGGQFDLDHLSSGAATLGQVPTADGDGNISWEEPVSGASALDDLTDVNAPSPDNNDILMWDADTGEWINSPPPGSGCARVVCASDVAALDTDLIAGGGTDDTAALQAVLDMASEGVPIELVMDGPALVSGLDIYSTTTIRCLQGGGFFLKNASNRSILRNANRSRGAITDQYIAIYGGYYNANKAGQSGIGTNNAFEADGSFMCGFQLHGINYLDIQDVEVVNSKSFGINIGNTVYLNMDNIVTDCGSSPLGFMDGIHLNGPITHGQCHHLKIHSWDDAIAIAAGDDSSVDLTDPGDPHYNAHGPYVGQGLISDLIIDGLELNDCLCGIRLLTHDANSRIDRVQIRNVTGVIRDYGFVISTFTVGTGSVGNVVLDGFDVSRGTEVIGPGETDHGLIRIDNHIEHLALRNIRVHQPIDTLPIIWVHSTAVIDVLEIEGYSIYDNQAGAVGMIPIKMDGYVKRFMGSRFSWARFGGVAQADVFISMANAASRIESLSLDGVVVNAVNYILHQTAGTAIDWIQARGIWHGTDGGHASITTTVITVTDVNMSNWYGSTPFSGTATNTRGDAFGGGGVLADHDHSGDAGDGGQFDVANLTSGGAGAGDIATADGAGNVSWQPAGAASGQYRQFVYIVTGGDFSFVIDIDGNPVMTLQDLE